MEQKEIPHMPADSIQPDAQQKQEYQQYVKSVTPTTQSVDADGESISDRRNHLLYRTGNSELYRKCAGDGSADFRKLVFPASGIFVCSTHGVSYLPQDCKMGRRRCIGTDHRIRQFRDSSGGWNIKRKVRYSASAARYLPLRGPVILYGIFSSWGLGLILWVLQMFGIRVG